MHSAFNLTLVHNLFTTCPPLPWGPTHQPYLHIYCFKIVPFIMLEILWNNCHTNVSRVMFPLFSVSLGQCRQRISYLCNIKIFCHFQNFIWGHLQTKNFKQIFLCPKCFDLWAAPWDVHLHFASEGIVLLWKGQGGEWSKGFFVLRKSFFSDRNPFVV